MFDLAVDLREGLLAAHGQHGVSEADEDNDQRQMAEPGAVEPAQRLLVELHDSSTQRVGRYLDGNPEDSDGAPDNQDHDHNRGDDHDLQSFFAGLVDALYVLPPEIKNDENGKGSGEVVLGKNERVMRVPANIVDKPAQILSR